MTFSPRARFSYFEETSNPYPAAVGFTPVTAGRGQLTLGSAISYKFVTPNQMTINTSLRFDSVADVVRKGDWNIDNVTGRIQASSGFGFAGGAHIDVTAALDGLGADEGNGGGQGAGKRREAREGRHATAISRNC